jgi:hypothetical protein
MIKERKATSIERELTRCFFNSVGIELGFYNPKTKELREGAESEGVYQTNLEIIRSALKDGWTKDQLEKLMWAEYRKSIRCALLSEILPEKEPEIAEEDNLLVDGVSYLHPALFNRMAPTFAVVGESVVPVSRGTSTPKPAFTLRDLLDYYYQIVKTGRVASRVNAHLGAFRYLFSGNSLDEILFAIDAAGDTDVDWAPLDLERFMREAREEVRVRRARAGG